ncbi:MAG: nucleotidyltransferase family protein [Caldilineaceae bacterium]
MKALILAAGKGTRLQQLTLNCPKPMLAVQGQPLLAHLVVWLRTHQITQIAMNLHHCPEVITEYFGDGRHLGVAITYSHEQTLLGTAGAAKRLQTFLDEPFVVVYGDLYTNLDLTRLIGFHHRHKMGAFPDLLATLALYRVPNPTECGLVEQDSVGRITRFVEKPPPEQVFTDLANAGVLICEPHILEAVPNDTVYDFGRDLFPERLEAGCPLLGQPLADNEFLIDIGTPNGYARAQQCAAKTIAGR